MSGATRSRLYVVVVALAALAASILIASCESSQSKSAKLDAEGADALTGQEGLNIKKLSTEVDVVGTTVLQDQNGTAVVVTLKSRAKDTLLDVPIAINVVDGKGKTLFRNNDPGLAASLVSIPVIEPGQEVSWVNDQVFANGKAAKVEVEVGEAPKTLKTPLPELIAGPATLANDPYVGLEASGQLTNKSDIEQLNVVVFAKATQGGKVVAAGVGGVRKVAANGKKPPKYHIYFIGDPTGADVEVTAFPSKFEK